MRDDAATTGGITVIASALPMELRALLRRGRFNKDSFETFDCYRGDLRGREVALLFSGMGPDRAYLAARAAIGQFGPSLYISAGLCGGLVDGLSSGEVVVAKEIITSSGLTLGCDAGLVGLAGGVHGLRTGRLLCADRVTVRPSEKRLLGGDTGAVAVDMESAGAARAATEADVRFIAVKAVSDTVDEGLPVDFNLFSDGAGSLDWPRFLVHVFTHPRAIPGLVRLSRNSGRAANALADALGRIIEEAPPENRRGF